MKKKGQRWLVLQEQDTEFCRNGVEGFLSVCPSLARAICAVLFSQKSVTRTVLGIEGKRRSAAGDHFLKASGDASLSQGQLAVASAFQLTIRSFKIHLQGIVISTYQTKESFLWRRSALPLILIDTVWQFVLCFPHPVI